MTSGPTVSPVEPSTKRLPPSLQPNAHPYAIKTTSSALLSRSNSSPYTVHHDTHHYIPLSPSRIPTGTRLRHRHTSSLPPLEGKTYHDGVDTSPAPLPTPPSIVAVPSDSPSVSLTCAAEEPKLTHRVPRGGTMLSSATSPSTQHHRSDQKRKYSDGHELSPVLCVGLPSNPKQWTTGELLVYLEESLRPHESRDGVGLMDILDCVRARGLTGRELLRLTDADLAGTSLSDAQCAQLLESSRILRAHVLRGRIYVDSYHSHEISDNSSEIYSRSECSPTLPHNIRAASASADDLHLLLDHHDSGEGQKAFPPPPTISLHRSNSVSDASAARYRDLARMRIRRRGRVQGLVETWERASTSGSECSEGSASASDAESESDMDPKFDEPPHGPSIADSTTVLPGSSSLPLPLPNAHMCTMPGVKEGEEEELSMEELLASSSNIPLQGGRAWEADFGLGETVKRIPADVGGVLPSGMELDTSYSGNNRHNSTTRDSAQLKGSGVRRSTGSREKYRRTRNRIVTAVFTGSPANPVLENACQVVHSADDHCHPSGTNGVIHNQVPASSDLQNNMDSALRALEDSIAATRAQMNLFRLRLEEVEAETARQEAILVQAELSIPYHTSTSELRNRRPGVNSQATTESTKPTGDKTFADSLGNKDLAQVWETISLADIARAIVAKTMGWVFLYGHLGAQSLEDHQAGADSSHGTNGRRSPLAKGTGRSSLVRASCSIILVSCAICATVLGRMGFGQWVRRP